MSEMVERVARAIRAATVGNGGEADLAEVRGGSLDFERIARAAILAMRDIPPIVIMEASKGGTINITGNGGVFWRAIIDNELGDP